VATVLREPSATIHKVKHVQAGFHVQLVDLRLAIAAKTDHNTTIKSN